MYQKVVVLTGKIHRVEFASAFVTLVSTSMKAFASMAVASMATLLMLMVAV